MKIWIDADSCPKLVRDFTLKYAAKFSVQIFLVANKNILSESQFPFMMIVCEKGKDSADNYILEHASIGDIIITRDVLLAEKSISKNICTINDRGLKFTRDNIARIIEDRNYNFSMAQIGFASEKKVSYGKKEFAQFVKCFEKSFSDEKRK